MSPQRPCAEDYSNLAGQMPVLLVSYGNAIRHLDLKTVAYILVRRRSAASMGGARSMAAMAMIKPLLVALWPLMAYSRHFLNYAV